MHIYPSSPREADDHKNTTRLLLANAAIFLLGAGIGAPDVITDQRASGAEEARLFAHLIVTTKRKKLAANPVKLKGTHLKQARNSVKIKRNKEAFRDIGSENEFS